MSDDPIALDLRPLENPVNPYTEHVEMLLNEDAESITDEELSRLKLVVERLTLLGKSSKYKTTNTALMVTLARLAVADITPGDAKAAVEEIDAVIGELNLIKKTISKKTVREVLASKKTVRDALANQAEQPKVEQPKVEEEQPKT